MGSIKYVSPKAIRAQKLPSSVTADLLWKTDQGALSQYCKLSTDWLEKRPPNVTPTQAAGFALAGLTAYDAVVNSANIQADQRVFINGGSSSVGAFAIQISKIKGAHVTTSASAKNEAFVRHLGADEACGVLFMHMTRT